MMIKKIAAAVALVACAPAFATIASAGNGELFLTVVDNAAKVSYTLDLGVTQNDFFTLGQQDAGYTRDWAVGDSNFSSFLAQVDATNLKWVVAAAEIQGTNAPGGVRFYTTLTNGQEAAMATWSNQQFSNGVPRVVNNFLSAVNTTGGHPGGVAVNGSSVNKETDAGAGYFGEAGGFTPSVNNTAPFSNVNGVNESSGFFYLTRSSTSQIPPVLVDQFDNLGGVGKFTLERNAAGAYNLDYTIAAVPEPGTYGLMLAGLAAVGFVARRRSAR